MIKMYHAIFGGRKFKKKCKSLIKTMNVRMEAIKNKRNAVEKYLRQDIEELLRNGFDIIAYERAEELLVETSLSSIYNQIEQFYIGISSQLSLMNENSECPEDCKENVATLIYVAARFSDLPELRSLRNIFTHKYGTSMEDFVNQEFVGKLRLTPKKEMKIKLLQDIANSSSIEWNPKALEQQLFVPAQFDHDLPQSVSDQMTDDYDECKLNTSIVHDVIQIQEGPESHQCKELDVVQNQTATPTTNDFPHKAHIRKPIYARCIPPPYVRCKSDNKHNEKHDQDGSLKSNAGDKTKSRSVRRRNSKLQLASAEQTTMEISNVQKRGVNHISELESEAGTGNLNADVHPMLPSYDELAARVADLSGKQKTERIYNSKPI